MEVQINILQQITRSGKDPTGIAIPRVEISYNPLKLQKDDGVTGSVSIGSIITYTISYQNTNNFPVDNVVLTDTLPNMANYLSSTGGGVHSVPTHSVWWQLFTLAPLETGSVIVTVQVMGLPAGAELDNTVVIVSDQTPPTTVHEYTDVRLTQVIPEVPYGTITTMALLLLGFAIYVKRPF